MLVDRKAFLSVIGITSMVLDAMSDEMQAVKESKAMTPEAQRASRQLISAHLQNVANLAHALSHCVVDPEDLAGTRMPGLN